MKVVAWLAHYLETREIVMATVDRIREKMAGHQFVICEKSGEIEREIVDADALFCYRFTPGLLSISKQLMWIQFGSAGIDHTVFPELLESNIILTTMSGIHTVPVAEHTIALMLSLSRCLHKAAKLQVEKCFDRKGLAAVSGELFGKTVGIIGLGKIGLNIARLAKAFGMRVTGSKFTPTDSLPNVDQIFGHDQLDKVLAECDYLVLSVPLTKHTNALIGEREIGLMKDGSYIVNIARGAMIDHEALRNALNSGKLAGAALDVFPTEPLPSDSAIYDLPNTIITPHTAASSSLYSERASQVFLTNFDAFLSGAKMINMYDKGRGY